MEAKAQAVLARAAHPEACLADLYDPGPSPRTRRRPTPTSTGPWMRAIAPDRLIRTSSAFLTEGPIACASGSVATPHEKTVLETQIAQADRQIDALVENILARR